MLFYIILPRCKLCLSCFKTSFFAVWCSYARLSNRYTGRSQHAHKSILWRHSRFGIFWGRWSASILHLGPWSSQQSLCSLWRSAVFYCNEFLCGNQEHLIGWRGSHLSLYSCALNLTNNADSETSFDSNDSIDDFSLCKTCAELPGIAYNKCNQSSDLRLPEMESRTATTVAVLLLPRPPHHDTIKDWYYVEVSKIVVSHKSSIIKVYTSIGYTLAK